MLKTERKEAGAFNGETGLPFDLDIKGLTDQGEFEGYASTFGNIDQGGDICVQGCFAESLAKRPASKVKMLLHHDTRRICGTWSEMVEDPRGLKVKGRLLLTTTDGRETYELMRAGALGAMSIGFRTLVDEIDRTSGVRKILKADLMEVSIVTFPMNERAAISSVKSSSADLANATKWLAKAIKLHEGHMDGSVPTSDASQKTMMDMMRRSYALLTGDSADTGGMKGAQDFTTQDYREIEASLRDAGLSRADAVKAVSGLKAWFQRDAGEPDQLLRDEAASAELLTLAARIRALAA